MSCSESRRGQEAAEGAESCLRTFWACTSLPRCTLRSSSPATSDLLSTRIPSSRFTPWTNDRAGHGGGQVTVYVRQPLLSAPSVRVRVPEAGSSDDRIPWTESAEPVRSLTRTGRPRKDVAMLAWRSCILTRCDKLGEAGRKQRHASLFLSATGPRRLGS